MARSTHLNKQTVITMKVNFSWTTNKNSYDTKQMKLSCLKARGARLMGPDEIDAELCVKDGVNIVIAQIHMGNAESSNALCEEIVRRFNEFPEELKR